jgi:hypothetical protein
VRKRALLVTVVAAASVAVFAGSGSASLQPPPGGGYVGCSKTGQTQGSEYTPTPEVLCYSYETAFYAWNPSYPHQSYEATVVYYHSGSYTTRFDHIGWNTDGSWHFSLNSSTWPYAKLTYNEYRYSFMTIYPAWTYWEVDQWAY